MFYLCIYGSPRINGNTDILLDAISEGIKSQPAKIQIEKVYIRDLKISPCRECRSCDKTGICIVKDDMQKLHDKICDADYVIIASPIFYYNVTAQLKTVIDRSQCFWARKYLLKKQPVKSGIKGIFVSVCASKPPHFFDCAKKTVKYYFDAYDIEYYRDFLVNKIDNYREILNQKDILQQAFEFGKEMKKG